MPNSISIFLHEVVLILLEFQHKLDVVVIVSRRDVKVEVENGLSRSPAVVRKDVESARFEAIDNRLRNDSRCPDKIGQSVLREFYKGLAVCFWDDQGVAVMNWIYVENGDGVRILVEDLCAFFVANYPAKRAIC